MAYQDGSRVALRLMEIEEAIQETNAELQALIDGPLFVTAEELAQRERDFKRLTDRLQGLHAAWQLQQRTVCLRPGRQSGCMAGHLGWEDRPAVAAHSSGQGSALLRHQSIHKPGSRRRRSGGCGGNLDNRVQSETFE